MRGRKEGSKRAKDGKRKFNSSLGKLIRFEHYLLLIFYIFFILQNRRGRSESEFDDGKEDVDGDGKRDQGMEWDGWVGKRPPPPPSSFLFAHRYLVATGNRGKHNYELTCIDHAASSIVTRVTFSNKFPLWINLLLYLSPSPPSFHLAQSMQKRTFSSLPFPSIQVSFIFPSSLAFPKLVHSLSFRRAE